MSKKGFIFYCDDNPKWIADFQDNHSDRYEILPIKKGTDFEPTLKDLISKNKTPDIILIDLFHPKHNDVSKQKKMEIEGKAAIVRLENAINEARIPIYAAWGPYGLDMLEQARALCPDTPIAIYTQQGLSIVKDDELIRVSDKKGEWLLKGRDKFYEDKRLKNMLISKNTRHYIMLTKKVSFILSPIIFIVFLVYANMVGKYTDFILSMGASLVIAFMPGIISITERVRKKKYKA